ncbi:hypothetical protein HHK36_029073 [Tetracentron sinense]|uniref:Aluminum-activated malate transporter n=1 Tax=Tetracentron sinense TaxID=13715 RepID=A0A835D386_TETSI|nr:hypothetical protein HHK36_029073 [Tetracentron sinense]
MNGKKGSIEIDIPSAASKVKQSETSKKSGKGGISIKGWIWNVWEFAKEDSNRVIFSLKVGLAVLLVSLLILFRAPYEVFGNNIIWSILTVAIMFEYTVGATFNRGFNRALGSLLAGVFAIIVAQMALCTGRVAEPIIIGVSIFLIGKSINLFNMIKKILKRVILFTFCLIIVSGYRMGSPIKTAMDRLYSIAIGGFVAVLVNVLVFPIWAGEQLHKELVNSFDSVADSLEECVRKYLEDDGSDHPEFSKTVMDEFPDEPAYRKCRETLNSSAKLESLAISAKWEPPHGRFCHFFYPWSEYVKVGAVLRYCAYEAPYILRSTFQSVILDASSQAAELLKNMGKDISNMKYNPQTSLQKRVHSSTERLHRAIEMHSYLLTSSCDLPDNPSKPLPRLSHAFSSTLSDLSNCLAELGSNNLEQPLNPLPQNTSSGALPPTQTESYHEAMRKQPRRLHSWPSREAEEEGGLGADFLPRMRALESTAALSLATFTSLLIEFVVRLDHLVEAVDELSKNAKFKREAL